MENDKSKSDLLQEFTELAIKNGVIRLNSDFLNRFLVGHQYDVFSALKSLQNFESFLSRRKESWLKLKMHRIETIFLSQVVEILEKTGLQGQTVVWIRVDKWNPQNITADEILEVSGLLCELVYLKLKEIKYIDLILDLGQFSLKHLYGLSPKFAKRMVFFMSECLPMSLLHIYVIRQPKIFYLVYSLFKPFLEESIRKSMKICGWDFDLLFVTIGKDNLPVELDGLSKPLDPYRWINLLYNKKIQQMLKTTGYEFY